MAKGITNVCPYNCTVYYKKTINPRKIMEFWNQNITINTNLLDVHKYKCVSYTLHLTMSTV